jgi:hypothetical protein
LHAHSDDAPCLGANRPDGDGDGLTDAFEQRLVERYAPVVYHSNHESNYPTNVGDFLSQTTLWF